MFDKIKIIVYNIAKLKKGVMIMNENKLALLNERNEIEWHDLECLSLHRAAYHSAVEKGCNAHYYIPIYTVKSHPIGYFICYYNRTKMEHANIKRFGRLLKPS